MQKKRKEKLAQEIIDMEKDLRVNQKSEDEIEKGILMFMAKENVSVEELIEIDSYLIDNIDFQEKI